MNIPPPTEKQAHIIWASLTGLALAIIVALTVGVIWGLGRVLDVLSPVIWPLAVAAVLAYLLDPVVDFLERRLIPRTRAIGLVFLVALFLVLAVFGSVVPRMVVETQQLVSSAPALVKKAETRVASWLDDPPAPLMELLKRLGVGRKPAPAATTAPPQPNGEPPVGETTNLPPYVINDASVAKSGRAALLDELDTPENYRLVGG